MKIKQKLLQKLDKKFGEKKWYLTLKNNYVSRTLVFAIFGSIITLCFALFNGIYGLIYKSIWYGSFAFFYIILSIQKCSLLLFYLAIHKKYNDDKIKLKIEKTKIYLYNGTIFIPLTISFGIVISMFFNVGKPSITGHILAIATAAYTTYKVTIAIIHLKKAIKEKDDILQALRNINMVEAIISIVLLANTLITTFGTFDTNMQTIIIILGLVSCIVIISLGIFMVVKAILKLKNNKTV